MTSRLVMTRKDPRRTDFRLIGDVEPSHYSSDTTHYTRPRNGRCATTTITRTDPSGERLQVGVIEWPIRPLDPAQLVVGTRDVPMAKSSMYTSCVRPVVFFVLFFFVIHDLTSVQIGTFHGCRRPPVRVANPRCASTGEGRRHRRASLCSPHTQLVPLRGYNRASTSYVATFVRSQSGFCFRRKHASSLFVPPEGFHILDDIVVTFIYFESKWRDKENAKHASLSM